MLIWNIIFNADILQGRTNRGELNFVPLQLIFVGHRSGA